MNFGLLSFAVLCTAINFLSAVQVGDFVVVSGLVNKPEYNGSIGLVQSVGERCVILKADDQCLRALTPEKDIDECMAYIRIKEENLILVAWKIPEKLSIAQMVKNYAETGQISPNVKHDITPDERETLEGIISIIGIMNDYHAESIYQTGFLGAFFRNFQPYIDRTIPEEEKEFLDRIVLAIRALCRDEPSQLLKVKTAEKIRLLGAWINQNHDFHAMVYVNEAYEPLKDSINKIWDQVGIWTSDEYVNVYI